jgi:hypothetical protein
MIKGMSHQYRVETSDRRIYYGKIHRGVEPGTMRIESTDTTYILSIKNVALINSFDKGSLKSMSGYLSSGFNYARSSNSGRFNLDALLKMQFRRSYMDIGGNMFISQTDSNWIRDRESFSIAGFYILNAWFAVGGLLKYQRNFELGLAHRYQEGLGIMATLLKHNNFQVRSLTGLVVNQEKSTEGEIFPTQVEIPLNVNLEFFRFSSPNISITTNQTSYFSLTEAGRLRLDGEVRVDWEIINDLALSLQYYQNFDNRPPSGGSRNWDYGLVTGLKYSF